MSEQALERLLTANEVAKGIMNCSLSNVYKMADRGELPCIRIGAMLRFSPSALRSFLAARAEAAPSQVAPAP